MIGILLATVLSSSTGQAPATNPMENNLNILKQNGAKSSSRMLFCRKATTRPARGARP